MGLFRRNKTTNNPLLRQIIDLVPRWLLNYLIKQYKNAKGCSKYKTYDQFMAFTFLQLKEASKYTPAGLIH